MGLGQVGNYSSYYYALNRAKWSCLALSRIVLYLVLALVQVADVLQFTLDDSLVRRYGKQIKMRRGVTMTQCAHVDAIKS